MKRLFALLAPIFVAASLFVSVPSASFALTTNQMCSFGATAPSADVSNTVDCFGYVTTSVDGKLHVDDLNDNAIFGISNWVSLFQTALATTTGSFSLDLVGLGLSIGDRLGFTLKVADGEAAYLFNQADVDAAIAANTNFSFNYLTAGFDPTKNPQAASGGEGFASFGAEVPLPAGVILLLSALGVFGFFKGRRMLA